MAEKRKRGRPQVPDDERKNRTVPFRCQEKLYEELVDAAKLNRRTISQEIEARLNQAQEMSDRIRDLEIRANEDRKTISQQVALLALSGDILKRFLIDFGVQPSDLPPAILPTEEFKGALEGIFRKMLEGKKE